MTLSLPHLDQRLGKVALAGAMAFICVASSWALTSRAHHTLFLMPVAALAFGALVLIVCELQMNALVFWIPASVIFYPLRDVLPASQIVSFDRLWIGAMLVLLLYPRWDHRAARATRRFIGAFSLFLALYFAQALLTANHRTHAIDIAVDDIGLAFILFFLAYRGVARNPALLDRLACSMAVAGVLLGLVGIAEHIAGFQLATLSGGTPFYDPNINEVRVSGPYIAPETYGLTLVSCLAATLLWTQLRPRSRMFAGGTAAVIECAAIAVTYFRTGWVSALIVILLAFAFRPHRRGRALGFTVGAALIVGVAALQLAQLSVFANRVSNIQNLYTRLAAYIQAIEVWHTHPWFGVGVGQYTTVASTFPMVSVDGTGSVPYPHDSFLGTLAENGVFGLLALLLLGITVVGLIRALNRRRIARVDQLLAACVVGAAIGYLLYSLTLWMLPYEPSNEFFALLLGMAAGRVDVLYGPRRAAATIGANGRSAAIPTSASDLARGAIPGTGSQPVPAEMLGHAGNFPLSDARADSPLGN